MQLTHYNSTFTKQTFPITLICDNVTNASNIGSIFRISDAFGIKQLILCGDGITLGRKMTKTSRSTEKTVNFQIKNSALDTVKHYKDSGYHIIALEITSNSTPMYIAKFPSKHPIVLVVGDENFGISERILKLSNDILHIDMFGQNSSMNVVQATNIALYEITKQLR
ncbi:TrmH family RNA methyltransferase [Hyunsoonleella ulvae]|uniref:TrmH family RNA methyltransferase n=1 Tax=Hyunsoonleella ulvae TaxID=2799948 RepID=UPI00193A16AC|nr:TrmH family RNA methyltransferase [Hyunsoonleella ulvae]